MYKYSAVVQYDSTDNIFVASIPELQGCKAHGKTISEAVKELEIVRDMWIETAKEKDIPIPEPRYDGNFAI